MNIQESDSGDSSARDHTETVVFLYIQHTHTFD